MSKFVPMLCGALAAMPSCAGEMLADALEESKLLAYGKVMQVWDDKKGGRPDQSSAGFGGKLGLETGHWQGWGLKGAWYVTSDLGWRNKNPKKVDAYMFDVDKTPYSLLGEASLSYHTGATTLTVGRQEFESPIINSYDYRIIPNLFEAWTLRHRPSAERTLTLAYVTRMSGLDGLVSFSRFKSMSQQTYSSLLVAEDGRMDNKNGNTLDVSRIVGERGVLVAGLETAGDNRLRLWNYYAPEVLNTWYADGQLKWPLAARQALFLEAQAYAVQELGQFKAYLAQQGLNARYALYGLKGRLEDASRGLMCSLAYNHFTGSTHTVSSFGNWGGYPEFVSMPYLFAENSSASPISQSRLAKLAASVDFAAYGYPGQKLIVGHARIDLAEAALPQSDISVNSLIYLNKLSAKLTARVMLEGRHSANSRYDNKFVTAGLRYDF